MNLSGYKLSFRWWFKQIFWYLGFGFHWEMHFGAHNGNWMSAINSSNLSNWYDSFGSGTRMNGVLTDGGISSLYKLEFLTEREFRLDDCCVPNGCLSSCLGESVFRTPPAQGGILKASWRLFTWGFAYKLIYWKKEKCCLWYEYLKIAIKIEVWKLLFCLSNRVKALIFDLYEFCANFRTVVKKLQDLFKWVENYC